MDNLEDNSNELESPQPDSEKAEDSNNDDALAKQDALLTQGRLVEVEGRAITIVTKDALLAFIQSNLPTGVSGEEVLNFYKKSQALEADKSRLAEQLAEVSLAKNSLNAELEECRHEISVLHERLNHQQERLQEADEKLAGHQAEVDALKAHNQDVSSLVEDRDQDLARLLAEKEAAEEELRILSERYNSAMNAADLKAQVLALEERVTKLLERIHQYQRDLSFAAVIREPESRAILKTIHELKERVENSPENVKGSLSKELARLEKLTEGHQRIYPQLFELMNDRKATIDVVVSLSRIAREDALVQRELAFLKSIIDALSTES